MAMKHYFVKGIARVGSIECVLGLLVLVMTNLVSLPYHFCMLYTSQTTQRNWQLKDTIKSLSSKISNLEALFILILPNLHSQWTQNHLTLLIIQSLNRPTVINESNIKLFPRGILPGERKFNVVIYGVAEHPNVTPRPERQKSDLANCLNIISKLNAEIDSHFILDCICLENYKKLSQTSCPHPLLLKLNYSVDVTTILANRAGAPQGITIRPDQTKEERQQESLSLGECWNDKKDIKIWSSTLYFKDNKHALVQNNCLQYFHPSNQTQLPAVSSVPGHTDSTNTTEQNVPDNVHSKISNWLPNNLFFLLWNEWRLKNSLHNFQSYIYSNYFDVIAITETWITKHFYTNETTSLWLQCHFLVVVGCFLVF